MSSESIKRRTMRHARRTTSGLRSRGTRASGSLPARSAFTLMELMVVIIIVVILTSSMIPIMSSASDARRCREGARLVSTMLSGAQTRAISTGRSCGVLFQPMKNNPYACMELYIVEVPPPYSGDDINYRAQISGSSVIINNGTVGGIPTFGGVQMSQNQNNNQKMIRPGDLIRFNYRGQLYLLNFGDTNPYVLASDSMGTAQMTLTPTDPAVPPPRRRQVAPSASPFRSFASRSRRQIRRRNWPTVRRLIGISPASIWRRRSRREERRRRRPPTRRWRRCSALAARSRTRPVRPVPREWSIIPPPNPPGTTCGPVIITFSSTGTIEQVYYSCYFATQAGSLAAAQYSGNPNSPKDMDVPHFTQSRPLSGAYLLVGKIEKISQLQAGPIQNDPTNLPNYQDSDARWVSITRQSGLVTTTEVAKLQPQYANFPTSGTPTAFVLGPSNPQSYTTYPQSVGDWVGILNAVMNSRRYASGNQNSGGI